jgi:hypothetical protein
MKGEQRFFLVRVKADAWTTVQVSAGDSEQAVERALARVPALGRPWQIKRTRAEIINVSRTEGGLGDGETVNKVD